MRRPGTKLGLQGMLLLMAFNFAPPSGAQVIDMVGSSSLKVCNKGSIDINVVVAIWVSPFPLLHVWDVNGWHVIAPGACKVVFDEPGEPPAYIGFGIFDSHHQFGAGTIERVPDLGFKDYGAADAARYKSLGAPVLTKVDNKKLCVRHAGMSYRLNDGPETNCATFHPESNNSEAYFPLAAALFFQPVESKCWNTGIKVDCGGGDYYLNVTANPNSGELVAAAGSASGEEQKGPSSEQLGNDLLKKIWEEAVKENEREKAAAETMAKLRAQEAADAKAAHQKRIDEDRQQKFNVAHYSAGDYDPQWMGKNMVLQGTVSRVEVKPTGFTHWVTIYFKESPDGAFTVCSPDPDLLQDEFGNDLSVLIGKTVEVMGQVEKPYCAGKGGSIRVVTSRQFMVRSAP